jgi:hypothetical protein
MVDRRERLSAGVYRGFFASENPCRYIVLLALAYLPRPVADCLRMLIFRGRSLVRRLRS